MTANRPTRFLLIVHGDGMYFHSAPIDHPSVGRVKAVLQTMSTMQDDKGTYVGDRVVAHVISCWLERYHEENYDPVFTKEKWDHAAWDGTFYQNGVETAIGTIDPRVYISEEDADVWTNHRESDFSKTTATLYELCMIHDNL